MKEGRVKTRLAKVRIQRGEASQGGCTVDRPSASPRNLDPCFSNEGVTHIFHFTPPSRTEFTMPIEIPQNTHTSSELPSSIEASEQSTPLPTPLIMSSL